MHPPVDAITPTVELRLEVEVVREPSARLEVGAHEPVRALEDPLRLRLRLHLMVSLGSELFG